MLIRLNLGTVFRFGVLSFFRSIVRSFGRSFGRWFFFERTDRPRLDLFLFCFSGWYFVSLLLHTVKERTPRDTFVFCTKVPEEVIIRRTIVIDSYTSRCVSVVSRIRMILRTYRRTRFAKFLNDSLFSRIFFNDLKRM